jgi:hypothetical protein
LVVTEKGLYQSELKGCSGLSEEDTNQILTVLDQFIIEFKGLRMIKKDLFKNYVTKKFRQRIKS